MRTADIRKVRFDLFSRTRKQELAFIRIAMRNVIKRHHPIHSAQKLIRKALGQHNKNKVAVSWSGGRCSTVVLYMAREIYPDIRVFHTDHGVHYPETARYVRDLTREWDLNLTVYKPEKTFWQCIDEYGWPETRRAANSKKGVHSRRQPKCCTWLKHKPEEKFRKDESIEAFLTGIRVAEAHVRVMAACKVGQFYLNKRLNAWKYHPILFWPTRKLAKFCLDNEIPLSPIYEKTDRSGCWPCTGYVGWRENLMRTNPKFHDFMVEKLGGQWMLDHFYRTRIEPPCKTERMT